MTQNCKTSATNTSDGSA